MGEGVRYPDITVDQETDFNDHHATFCRAWLAIRDAHGEDAGAEFYETRRGCRTPDDLLAVTREWVNVL